VKAEDIKGGELSSAPASSRISELTHLMGENDDEVDIEERDPEKVPKRRLSSLFSFLAVWALFLVF
jgi:hypothetical protein